MELRATTSEEPNLEEKITKPGDFVVLTGTEPRTPSIRWLPRVAQGLLFGLFLFGLSTLSFFLLNL